MYQLKHEVLMSSAAIRKLTLHNSMTHAAAFEPLFNSSCSLRKKTDNLNLTEVAQEFIERRKGFLESFVK